MCIIVKYCTNILIDFTIIAKTSYFTSDILFNIVIYCLINKILAQELKKHINRIRYA